jgi:hypothetical protein
VRVFPQRIVVQQPQSRGQCSFVLPLCCLTGHQPPQRIGKQGFQPVTLVDDPVIVKTGQKVAPVERHGRFQARDIVACNLGLESIHVEPKVRLRIKLYRVGIAQDVRLIREAATNVPQSGGEGVACLGRWPITPKQVSQLPSGLGQMTMVDQESQ